MQYMLQKEITISNNKVYHKRKQCDRIIAARAAIVECAHTKTGGPFVSGRLYGRPAACAAGCPPAKRKDIYRISMNKKDLAAAIGGYVIWGMMTLYWSFLNAFNPLFVLANRILWSAVFTVVLLIILKKMPQFTAVMKDKRLLKFLIPAAFAITTNWGLYIYAVNSGHVMDASLGYYMNPLAVFACGVFIFKERYNKLDIAALALAGMGVIFATVQRGSFPYIAVVLAVLFAAYGTLKKFTHVDSLVSVAVETMFTLPFALGFILLNPTAGYASAAGWQLALLMGGGVVTAVPLILYARGVNNLPFTVMAFLQYITPTLMLITGLMRGEAFSWGQACSFGLIWIALVLFSINMVRRAKTERARAAAETA